MEFRRLLLLVIFATSSLFLYQRWLLSQHPPTGVTLEKSPSSDVPQSPVDPSGSAADGDHTLVQLPKGRRVHVKTDLLEAEIDTVGGDIRILRLLNHGTLENGKRPFLLLQDQPQRLYVAQSGFADSTLGLPTHHTRYTVSQTQYTLAPGQQHLTVRLTAPTNQRIRVEKRLTFTRGRYGVDVGFDIANDSGHPISPHAYFRMVHDGGEPESSSRFVYTFTGGAVYTEQGKYQKVSFSDIDKGKQNFVTLCNNGWVGMVQHYFISVWLPRVSPTVDKTDCLLKPDRRFELRRLPNGAYSIGTILEVGQIADGSSKALTVPLYSGPEDYEAMMAVDPSLVLTKDYGIFTVVAAPLFWMLVKLHQLVGNWGWAIILLTLIIKLIFYYPSAASYRSMAKMRALAPQLQRLKERFSEDRQQLHQAMMELYKKEKINPLGGCLPILIQIPVFMGLYWVLLASVELRQARWMFWINDLSMPDRFYILPLLMAASMWYQSTLNPPVADPLQAKMMKFMPLVFSVFFFFSPSGLVLYWLVNNLLSIFQQKLIYRDTPAAAAAPARAIKPR